MHQTSFIGDDAYRRREERRLWRGMKRKRFTWGVAQVRRQGNTARTTRRQKMVKSIFGSCRRWRTLHCHASKAAGAVQVKNTCQIITQVCDEFFFSKVRVVSYVFWYADFGKNTQRILARTLLHKSRISVWTGLSLVVLLISNTGRWWNFFL